jgi:hypothetical protein
MDNLYEALRRERPMIKAAPWSFALALSTALLVLLPAGWGVIAWIYSERIADKDAIIQRLQLAPEIAEHPSSPRFNAIGSGCTVTNFTGRGSAGTFTLTPGPCKAVTIKMGSPLTAPNGWHCTVGDKTMLAKGIWFGEWNEDVSTRTTVKIPIPQAAYQNVDSKGNTGTDVISFACTAY